MIALQGQTALNVVSVLAAVHTVVPGALATHAESEGSKACYIFCRPPTFEDPNAVPMASEDACELDTDLELPRSQRFRLAFPTGKVALILRDSPSASGLPINLSAVVCLSSVLEYLCAEILELSGNAIRNSQQGEQTTRINPNHVRMAIQGDAELTALLVTACSPDPTFNEVPESFKGPAVYDNRERTWNFDISSDDEAAPELADD